MKFRPAFCPKCRKEATGTLETILGIADLSFDAGTLTFEYAGETKVDWNSQRTVVDDKGRVTLNCGTHEWKAKLIPEKEQVDGKN